MGLMIRSTVRCCGFSSYPPNPQTTLEFSMLRNALIALAVSGILVGCGDNRPSAPPTLGEFVIPSGPFNPFYAEIYVPEKKRIFLIGTKDTYTAFKKGATEMPQSIGRIRVGPNKESVTVETMKDDDAMARRLMRQFSARWSLPSIE